ncbi:MAG: formimidoylglutamase [Candidatus Neomarinimicrobiota bacterium]
MELFSRLNPVDKSVFYTRNDPNDIRLGDIAMSEEKDYRNCNVVMLGCPQDEGIRRNNGRTGARMAPQEIRKALYRYPISNSHKYLRLFDIGNLPSVENLEQIHELQFHVVTQLIQDGKKVIVLGGGNDISYPDCRALAGVIDPLLVFNIDRHLDVRVADRINSGTPYRQLLDERIICPELFHEVGINSFANSPVYIDYVNDIGANIHYIGVIRATGIKTAIQSIVTKSSANGIFFGFDLDAVRAVEAPGVSDPSPMGFTAREICAIADVAAADHRTKLIEITEVNPQYDSGDITSKLAANIIMRCLAKD